MKKTNIYLIIVLCMFLITGCSNGRDAVSLDETTENNNIEEADNKADARQAGEPITNEYVSIPAYLGIEVYNFDIADISNDELRDAMKTVAWNTLLDEVELREWDRTQYQNLYNEYLEWYEIFAESEDLSMESVAVEFGFGDLQGMKDDIDEAVLYSLKEAYVAQAIVEADSLEIDDKEGRLDKIAKDYGYGNTEDMEEDMSEEDVENALYIDAVSDYIADYCIIIPPDTDENTEGKTEAVE